MRQTVDGGAREGTVQAQKIMMSQISDVELFTLLDFRFDLT